MSASTSKLGPLFGFISIADLGGAAWIGGYLLLNSQGRPVEFHCTEPVKANRAQQILFGKTLQPYICGEQISQALVSNTSLKPEVFITDQDSVLGLRDFVESPLVRILHDDESPDLDGQRMLCLGKTRVLLEERYADDQPRVLRIYEQIASNWDLEEPFERIHEAVTELQKAA